jgi:hypothetical protein
MPTFTDQVNQSSDDASQNTVSAAAVLTNQTVNLVASSGAHQEYFGARFQNVLVPQGTIPTAASFNPAFVNSTNSGTITIWCEAADNSATFAATTSNISNRSPTAHSVSWNLASVTSSAFNASPDMSLPIGDVLGRPGFASGNALSVITQGPTPAGLSGVIDNWDNPPTGLGAPELSITYASPSSLPPRPLIVGNCSVMNNW